MLFYIYNDFPMCTDPCNIYLYRPLYYLFVQAPVISNLPASVDIIESKAASTTDILFTLTASDPENDIFTCTVQSTAPSVSAFLITDDSGSKFYVKNDIFSFRLKLM